MKIHFKCPNCDTKYSALVKQAGKEGKCKNCGSKITVPREQLENSVEKFQAERKPIDNTGKEGSETRASAHLTTRLDTITELDNETEVLEEGMTGGEWIGAFLCTPYGLIKYFEWKNEYPKKASQVCTLYLILLAANILFTICQIAIETSRY